MVNVTERRLQFPEDLSGHFWARLKRREDLDRWQFEVLDYQNNVMLAGFARTVGQATAIVTAWDSVVAAGSDEEDPSLDWSDD